MYDKQFYNSTNDVVYHCGGFVGFCSFYFLHTHEQSIHSPFSVCVHKHFHSTAKIINPCIDNDRTERQIHLPILVFYCCNLTNIAIVVAVPGVILVQLSSVHLREWYECEVELNNRRHTNDCGWLVVNIVQCQLNVFQIKGLYSLALIMRQQNHLLEFSNNLPDSK